MTAAMNGNWLLIEDVDKVICSGLAIYCVSTPMSSGVFGNH